MLRIVLLISFSSLFFSCGIARPDTDLCVVNVPALHERCYNLKRDYNDSGERKKSAKPKIIQYKTETEMLAGLNKKITTDANGFGNLKAYIRKLREILGD